MLRRKEFQDKFSGKYISNMKEVSGGYLLFYNGRDQCLHKYSMHQMKDLNTVNVGYGLSSRIEVDQHQRVWMVSRDKLNLFTKDLENIQSFQVAK